MGKTKGFTLIELLVVVMIIGLVSTLAIISLNSARLRSRDAKRWSDVRAIQSSIELCINEGGTPPLVAASWNGLLSQTCAVGIELREFTANDALPTPPQGENCTTGDPAAGDCYMYCQDAGTDDYLVFSNYEGSAPAGGLDGTINSYDLTECIMSNDLVPTALPDCDPVDGGTFCLGEL